jgi:hypothetical protein
MSSGCVGASNIAQVATVADAGGGSTSTPSPGGPSSGGACLRAPIGPAVEHLLVAYEYLAALV